MVNSIAVANSDNVHGVGNRGAGVRVAVWERGPDDTSDLDVEDVFDSSGDTSAHSRLVHAAGELFKNRCRMQQQRPS